jgi:hypothetical protein
VLDESTTTSVAVGKVSWTGKDISGTEVDLGSRSAQTSQERSFDIRCLANSCQLCCSSLKEAGGNAQHLGSSRMVWRIQWGYSKQFDAGGVEGAIEHDSQR